MSVVKIKKNEVKAFLAKCQREGIFPKLHKGDRFHQYFLVKSELLHLI